MIILGTNSIKDTGFDVANSVRFNSGSSDYLNRTPDSQSTNKFTWSAWIKRSKLSSFEVMWNERPDDNNFTQAYWESGSPVDSLSFQSYKSGSYHYDFKTNRLFRDPSAWYHIIFILDTTLGTQADRIKIYVNGVRETSFHTSTNNISQNDTLSVNSNTSNNLKLGSNGSSGFFNGYMCEVVYVSNNALAHTDLGEFDEDSGIWKPINVSGLTFDTAGYYLDFEDSAALGDDVSGNGNDFTVNNLTAIDQSTDTPTTNFCTMNALDLYFTNDTLSEGNLLVTNGANYGFPISTFGLSSGKWYFECQTSSWTSGDLAVGISARGSDALGDEFSNNTSGSIGYGFRSNGGVYGGGVALVAADGYTTGSGAHIIGMAVNLDDNKLAFSVNGTWQGSTDPGAGTTNMLSIQASSTNDTGVYFIALSGANSGAQTMNANFGSPAFSISSGNADANGHGNFEYAVPSGYFALCTKNLAGNS